MFSIRSILLAAAAFATFTSAVPVESPVGGASGLTDPSNAVSNVVGVVTGGNGGLATRGQYNPYDSFHTCSDGIAAIVIKIDAAIHVDGGAKNVDHNVVIGLLKEILVLLGTLLFELKGGDYHGCDVNVLGGLLAGLLIVVVEVLFLVIEVVGTVDVVLYGVVGSIGGLLCEILDLVFGLVDGLLAVVVVILVEPFSTHCHSVDFLNVLAILHL
jgi:hypothetical protein